MRTAEAVRAFTGAPLLSRGFRPFFLGAGLFALAAIAVYIGKTRLIDNFIV